MFALIDAVVRSSLHSCSARDVTDSAIPSRYPATRTGASGLRGVVGNIAVGLAVEFGLLVRFR